MYLIYSAEILLPSVTVICFVPLLMIVVCLMNSYNMVGALKTTSFCQKNYVSSWEKNNQVIILIELFAYDSTNV